MKLIPMREIRKFHLSWMVTRRTFMQTHNLLDKENDSYDNKDKPSDNSTKVHVLLSEAYTSSPAESEASFPSDESDHLMVARREKESGSKGLRSRPVRPRKDPKLASIFLFPGQGSQFVGMGSSVLKYPNVSKMYEIASDILGYDLLDICVKGPASKLNKTMYCQPAVLVASLAAIEKLKEVNPQAVDRCIAAAGFSVGEFAALVFAGGMSFEDAVEVIKVRASAMQKASEIVDSGLMTVSLGAGSRLGLATQAAKQYCSQRLDIEDPVCQVANYLCTEYKVLGGHSEALKFIEENKEDFNIRNTKLLPVSGAFHTQLMKPAVPSLRDVLKRVNLQTPRISVYSNFKSAKYGKPDAMRDSLVNQVRKPVKWEQILHLLYERHKGEDFPNTYEVGPGRQLGLLLRKTNLKAYNSYTSINV